MKPFICQSSCSVADIDEADVDIMRSRVWRREMDTATGEGPRTNAPNNSKLSQQYSSGESGNTMLLQRRDGRKYEQLNENDLSKKFKTTMGSPIGQRREMLPAFTDFDPIKTGTFS